MAIIFAWTGALRKKGEIDDIPELVDFCDKLEKTAMDTIEIDGIMTGDLARISEPQAKKVATTQEFIDAIANRFEKG
jgi:isocitrate dehydrogenase